jgi:hypothetical protein
MPRRRLYKPLRVLLNNRLVGHLLKVTSCAIFFQYDEKAGLTARLKNT